MIIFFQLIEFFKGDQLSLTAEAFTLKHTNSNGEILNKVSTTLLVYSTDNPAINGFYRNSGLKNDAPCFKQQNGPHVLFKGEIGYASIWWVFWNENDNRTAATAYKDTQFPPENGWSHNTSVKPGELDFSCFSQFLTINHAFSEHKSDVHIEINKFCISSILIKNKTKFTKFTFSGYYFDFISSL